MGEYKDRSIATIQHDVEKQFNEIEKKNGMRIRDDLKIAQAGIKTCWAYIHAIKSDKSINYGGWALEPLTKLQWVLKQEIDKMTTPSFFTHNKDQIYQIANRIDNAEREVLKRLGLNNTNRDSRELVKKSEKKHNGKNIFIMEGGSNLTKQTGNLIFTKESNPVKIHDALKGLFKDPNQVYQIDYSKCTNPKIKAIMSKLAGTETCYLRYDAEQKTYTICDKDGKQLRNRAYIWEGVRLIPDGVRQWTTASKSRNFNEINNIVDKLNSNDINNKSETYLKNNETLKQKDFNRLFSGKENIRQGRLWDCYLITTINILSRSQIFGPLIRTSVRIVQWGYTIRLPLWEPQGKTISIENSELNAAAVQGNIWYKILEIAYAKQTTGESIMTNESIKKIRGGRPSKALQTLVGKHNIGFTTLWGHYTKKTKKDLASNSTLRISSETDSQNLPIPYSPKEISQVKNTLKNYQLAHWTKFIAVSSYPAESDQHFYKIEGKQIFYKHAYAVLWVEKDSKGNISRVLIQNPWNMDDKNKPNNGKWNFSLSFENFLKAFPLMDIGNTTRKIFDWKTENGDLSIADNRRRRIKVSKNQKILN